MVPLFSNCLPTYLDPEPCISGAERVPEPPAVGADVGSE